MGRFGCLEAEGTSWEGGTKDQLVARDCPGGCRFLHRIQNQAPPAIALANCLGRSLQGAGQGFQGNMSFRQAHARPAALRMQRQAMCRQ